MPRFARNVVGRDFAVGDIHGCFSDLQRALDAIGFDPAVDRLFCVGDLVDRGPESDQVLAWLDRPWFASICGNHDFLAWRSALGNPYPEVDHLAHGGEWLELFSPSARAEVGMRLQALPLAIEVETSLGLVGLAHADCPFDDWQDMQAAARGGIDPESSVGECCLWSIERYRQSYAGHVRNLRALVHGHMAIRKSLVLGNVHFIDTGGWRPGGCFSFLNLETLQVICGPRQSQPTTKAINRKNR